MASSMIDMCTMGGSDLSGGIPMGSPQDVRNHPETNLPEPGYSPAVVHGTGMAGSQKMGLDALSKMTSIK